MESDRNVRPILEMPDSFHWVFYSIYRLLLPILSVMDSLGNVIDLHYCVTQISIDLSIWLQCLNTRLSKGNVVTICCPVAWLSRQLCFYKLLIWLCRLTENQKVAQHTISLLALFPLKGLQ